MCCKAERGFKTHGATVREGINTDGHGEETVVNRAASKWQPGLRDSSLSELNESSVGK